MPIKIIIEHGTFKAEASLADKWFLDLLNYVAQCVDPKVATEAELNEAWNRQSKERKESELKAATEAIERFADNHTAIEQKGTAKAFEQPKQGPAQCQHSWSRIDEDGGSRFWQCRYCGRKTLTSPVWEKP